MREFSKHVKLHLVALAEYLQCQPLSDMQIQLYAGELMELGPEGLELAIVLLKQDPEVWAGRMPLPAKLKQYVHGDIAMLAIQSARKIMALSSVPEFYTKISRLELEVATEYGINSIVNRQSDQTPMIFAQLRDNLKARIRSDKDVRVLSELPRRDKAALFQETRAEKLSSETGEGGQLEAGLHVAGEDTWPD